MSILKEEQFQFLALPYLCQKRFAQLLQLQDALNLSKCNQECNSIILKAVGKIGKLFISKDFKPNDSMMLFESSEGYGIHDIPCFGITFFSFEDVIFTSDDLDLFPAWDFPMDITIAVKWILEGAFVQLIYANISSFKFRGRCCFNANSAKLEKILSRLSNIKFVDVKFEDCMFSDGCRRRIDEAAKKFPNLIFEFYKRDVNVRTKAKTNC